MSDVAQLARDYRDLAATWGNDSGSKPKQRNDVYDRLHRLQKRLAATAEGQQAIAALMNDADPWVRLSAASHSLGWDEDRARTVLEELRDSEGSSAGFDAKYVLREQDASRLTFDF